MLQLQLQLQLQPLRLRFMQNVRSPSGHRFSCKDLEVNPAAVMDQQPEPQSFSFRTASVMVCAMSPARVPTFTALPKAPTFSSAPVTSPSAKPLAFRQRDAASTPSNTSASYCATSSIAADLTCYETLVRRPAVS